MGTAAAGIASVAIEEARNARRDIANYGATSLSSGGSSLPQPGHFPSALGNGTGGATWIASLRLTSVASSVVLVTTTPVWVAIASPWLLREPTRPGEVVRRDYT